MGCHRVEIVIIVKQRQFFHDTKSCDNDINGFPYGHPNFSKGAVISGTLNGDFVSTNFAERQNAKEGLGCFEILVCFKTLKNLCEDQISNDNRNM